MKIKVLVVLTILQIVFFCYSSNQDSIIERDKGDYSNIVQVKQDGTGDYDNIGAALQAAIATNENSIIYLYGPGTYSGADNINKGWNGSNIDIWIYGINNPTIDCENSGRAFALQYSTQGDIIQGLNIINAKTYTAGGAIRVKDGEVQLIDNTFTNCQVGSYVGEYDFTPYVTPHSRRGGAVFIEHQNYQDKSYLSGNSFDNCVTYEGGAVCIESGTANFDSNNFTNNHAGYTTDGTGHAGPGGAIYFKASSGSVQNSSFVSNSSSNYGIAISSLGNVSVEDCYFDSNYATDRVTYSSRYLIHSANMIKNNIFVNHQFNYEVYDDYFSFFGNLTCTIENNTFINNNVDSAWNELEYKNCILMDHIGGFYSGTTLSYCSIYNSQVSSNLTLNNCLIDVDPLLDSDFNPIWNTNAFSPLIDAGDPAILDPDGTPSDIGTSRALSHDYHKTIAQPRRCRWVSFPVIDRQITNGATAPSYICETVESQTNYFLVRDQDDLEAKFYEQNWTSDLTAFDSKVGYKITTADAVEIPTSGKKLADNTIIDLDAGSNWVGYFIKETLSIEDALINIWDKVVSVSSEDWFYDQQGSYPPDRAAMIYGKMYIVNVSEACSFRYQNGTPVPPNSREMTEGFSYTETADYTPINIQNIADPEVVEVGLFKDGVCIGASKVKDFPVQILAFDSPEIRGEADFSFEFYYGNRKRQVIKDFAVYNETTGKFSDSKIMLIPYHRQDVRFGEAEEITPTFRLNGNYPNPFNPTTTIQYSLPAACKVRLEIFNSRGQKINTIFSGQQKAGDHHLIWNGDDESGKRVSSGVYLYKLSAGAETTTRKMLMMK